VGGSCEVEELGVEVDEREETVLVEIICPVASRRTPRFL
jgi:hypothetical protein